jgi:protein TonB
MIMKRNESKVPEFNEIIFENRNREYGAYDLRKRSTSVTSFSILVAVTICVALVTVSFKTTERGTGSEVAAINVVAVLDNYDPNLIKVEPPAAPPAELEKVIQNVAPEVVTDTALVTSFIPISEELTRLITDGDVNDTIIAVYAEPEEIVPAEPEPYIRVEEMPEFPGGDKALLEFIAKNLKYPKEATDNNIEGRVYIQFVVKPDGSVGSIVVLKGVDPVIDNEAVRVVGLLPKMKPGKQNGVPVPVWFSVPVTFQLIY